MNINLDNGTFTLTKNNESIDVFTTLKRIIDSGIIPIPVEGDVQIFANAECTRLPSGITDTVYARFNTGAGFNESWGDATFMVETPSEEVPDDPYRVIWDIDFMSESFNEPFTAGQVVMLTTSEAYDVSLLETTFYKP